MSDRARITTVFDADTAPLKGGMKEVEGKAKGMADVFKGVGAAIAGAFAVRAIVNFGVSLLKAADDADNLSKRLGIGVESVQSLTRVAKESGLAMGDFEAAILRLQRSQADAQTGSKELQKAFGAMGISMDEIGRLNTEQLFDRVSQALRDNAGNADVVSAAYDILGRSGGRLVSTMQDIAGKGGLQAVNEEMIKLGLISSKAVIQSLDEMELTLDRSKARIGTYSQFVTAAIAHWLNIAPVQSPPVMTKERAAEWAAYYKAQNDAKRIAEERADVAEAIAAYEKTAGEIAEKNLTPQDRLLAKQKELKDLMDALNLLRVQGNGSTAEAWNLAQQILLKTQEVKTAEEAVTRARKDGKNELEAQRDVLADIQSYFDGIRPLEEQLYRLRRDAAFEAADDAGKMKMLQDELLVLQNNRNRLVADGLELSDEVLRIDIEIEKKQQEITKAAKDQVKPFGDTRDVLDGIEKASGAFGKNIKDLSQAEIKKLEDNLWAIKRIVDALAGAGGFPALNLPDFSALNNIPEWARKPDAGFGISNLGLALNKLKLILDGIVAAGGIPSLEFTLPDMSKTDVDGLVKILNATSRARFGELSIKLDYPDEGVPIAGIETFRELAASAKIIAEAKGVIWK